MIFKELAILVLVTLSQIQNIESRSHDQWTEANEVLALGRAHISKTTNDLHRKISGEIKSIMDPLGQKLSNIFDEARELLSECAEDVLYNINIYFASQTIIWECYHDVEIEALRSKYMKQIDDLYYKLYDYQKSCQDQTCIDEATRDIQKRVTQIQDEINEELAKMSEDMMQCIPPKSIHMIEQANEIELKWKNCKLE